MRDLPIYGIDEFSDIKFTYAFYANILKEHLIDHQFVNSPHKHSTYISILFTTGYGEHQIDFDTYEVKPGSVFLISPGQVHNWKLSENADGFVFFHTKEFYDQMYSSKQIEDYPFFYLQQNYPVIHLQEENLEQFSRLFSEIVKEYKSNLPYKWEKIGVLLDYTYIELARIYHVDPNNGQTFTSNSIKVKKLQKLIDDHFKTHKFPKDYADWMNITTRHLSRICRDVLNKSTNDLIIERVVMEAKRMLVHQDVSVSQVGDELGYSDYSHFVRLFKQKVGVTPKAFQLSSLITEKHLS